MQCSVFRWPAQQFITFSFSLIHTQFDVCINRLMCLVFFLKNMVTTNMTVLCIFCYFLHFTLFHLVKLVRVCLLLCFHFHSKSFDLNSLRPSFVFSYKMGFISIYTSISFRYSSLMRASIDLNTEKKKRKKQFVALIRQESFMF